MALRPIRFTTRDCATAEDYLRSRWSAVDDVQLGERFTLEVNGVRGGDFGVERLTHTSSLRVATPRPGPIQVVELLAGTAYLEHGEERTSLSPGDVVAVDAETTSVATSRAATLGVVTLPRELLAEAAQVPAERLRFLHRPVAGDWADHWRRAVRRTSKELAARMREDRGADGAAAARLLATAAFAAFPHELAPADGTEDGPVGRAVAFIDAHAREPLTVGDIAAAAGTSVRALQQGFARHHDTSPTAYLRRVRLEGAHRDLAAAEPDGDVTVAGVAAAWGFSQPGRFAAHYREAFGLLPSETLRARPGDHRPRVAPATPRR